MFTLVPNVAQPEWGTGPALVTRPQHTNPQAQATAQVHQPQGHQRTQSLRTQPRMRKESAQRKMPLAYPGASDSRPSSRESQPTSESFTTARGASPNDPYGHPQPRLPRGSHPLTGARDYPPAAGYDGRYPPHPAAGQGMRDHERRPYAVPLAERLHRPVPPTPDEALVAPPAVPSASRMMNLDAMIAAQIASRNLIPGVHASNPPRDNKWDDLFATALFGCAYTALSREEKKHVQGMKLRRGAQIAASGAKGLAKEKAGPVLHRLAELKSGRSKAYTQADYERDAMQQNDYAIYASHPDLSYGAAPAAEKQRSASHGSSKSGGSGRTAHPNAGRRHHEGQV